jgi:hypothetical protein
MPLSNDSAGCFTRMMRCLTGVGLGNSQCLAVGGNMHAVTHSSASEAEDRFGYERTSCSAMGFMQVACRYSVI